MNKTSRFFAQLATALMMFALTFGALGVTPAQAAFSPSTFQSATQVLGQANFTTATAATTQTVISLPTFLAVDPTTVRVFVADYGSNRVLRFTSVTALANGAAAEAVLGQANFTTATAATTQNGMWGPIAVFVDSAGRLWVADYANNRVLRFDNASALASGANASAVLGQPDFISRTAATSQTGMRGPTALHLDSGGRLWVAERDNGRVLRFDSAASLANGAAASGVLGRPDFTSTVSGCSATLMSSIASGVWVDSSGRLWVADNSNHRILRFDNAAGLANGASASAVLGQGNLTTCTSGTSQNKFSNPNRVSGDPAGRLYVSDFSNNRVMVFDNAASLANGANASYVLGQPDFTTGTQNTGGLSASSLYRPYGMFYDPLQNILWVADGFNNRVLRYGAPDITAWTLLSFTRQNPATSPTSADTLVFRATFSKDVQNVDAADFTLTGTTATITGVTPVSASVYDITVSGGNLASLNGTVGLNLSVGQNITDLVGNPLPAAEPATDETYVVENNPCTANVAESNQYAIAYKLSLPVNADYNGASPTYSVNNTSSIPDGSFSRIGYCLELDSSWVWVSMDAFTANDALTGVPVGATIFQQQVGNMNVASNVAGVTTGTGITTGNIEFWSLCYGAINYFGLPGASSSLFDYDDIRINPPGCYGSMQVHNYGAAQTIFAWNSWDNTTTDDLGIGNSPSGDPDWTFRANAASYTTRTLTVYVGSPDTTPPTVTSATSTTADGAYGVGGAINITLTFSESISSAAGLAITLDTGAVINSGALTNVSSYSTTYTVGAGETSSDLTISSISGTITDAAANSTTNPAIPAGQNIADSKSIVIDTTSPTITIIEPDTLPATSKTITASTSEGTLSMSNTTGAVCDGTLTFAAYASQTFTAESDNGTRVCYRAVDTAGNTSYSLSNAIAGIDTTAPGLTSFTRQNPLNSPTNADTLVFRATFSEGVQNVDASDFSINATPATTASISAVTPVSAGVYDITVSGGDLASYNGVIGLDLSGGQNITDPAGNALPPGEPGTDETYTLDNTAPGLTSFTRQNPLSSPTNADTLVFRATFSEDVQNVDASDFMITGTTAAITGVAPVSASVYDITVSGGNLAALNGTVGLNLAGGENITDLTGNPLPAVEPLTDETYTIDNTFPTVVYGLNTVPADQSVLITGLKEIVIEYDKDVQTGGGANAADNTANYLLVSHGSNALLDTISCVGGLQSDDTQIAINTVTYDNNSGVGPYLATLKINNGFLLPVGRYTLFICGTSSIYDPAGNRLNNGADSRLRFTITTAVLPDTGFAQGRMTNLLPQAVAYGNSSLWLEIPDLGVKMSILSIPLSTDGNWDVSWLGRNAGWLEGTAFPTWSGNSVITGHVWNADNTAGPFVGLKSLWYGDQIIVHGWGDEYVYEVRSVMLVRPDSTIGAFQHRTNPWLTLTTCHSYDLDKGTYRYRVIVQAVLVEVR